MITGVHAIGLRVTDVERAIAVFGAATPLEQLDAPGPALLRGANVHLELSLATSGVAAREVHHAGLAHLCLQQRDIAPLRTVLENGGVRFLSPPVDLGTGFLYAYGRDPDGLLLETEGAPFAPSDPVSWFGHLAFVTPDLKRLAAFYAALIGRPQARGMRLKGDPKYDAVTGVAGVDLLAGWVPGGNLSLEFWQYLSPATQQPPVAAGAPAYTHVTFESDAVEADLAHAVGLGGEPDGPLMRSAEGERARLRDPDGNSVQLVRWSGEARRFSIDHLPHPDILDRVRDARGAAAA